LRINLNTQVNVRCLKFTDTSCFQELKDSEINKVKAYSCIVKSQSVLDQAKIEEANKLVNLKLQ
jgi:tRNA pseudouridine synthase 10